MARCLAASTAVWRAIEPCEIVLIEPRADRAPAVAHHSPDPHALLSRPYGAWPLILAISFAVESFAPFLVAWSK